MWETRSLRFPRKKGNPWFCFLGDFPSSVISTAFLGARSKLLEQFLFSLLHAPGGFSITEGLGDALEDRQAHALTQIARDVSDFLQGLPRCLVTEITAARASFLIPVELGLGTRTMEVEIGIEVMKVKLLQWFCLRRVDVAIPDVLANHGSVLGLDQTIIVAVPGTTFGLPNQQFVQQTSDGGVNELAAVVGVKAENAKRKLLQQSGQHRL